MKVAILGAGALGSWFGAQLALHGCDVQLLTTNAAHRDAINANGLSITHEGTTTSLALPAYSPADIQAPVDLVLLLTKTFQSPAALEQVAHALDEHTHVLSLQNGLGNSEAIGKHLPLERAWIGVTMVPADRPSPGAVECKGGGASYFGNAAYMDEQSMAKRIRDAFEPTPIDMQHVDNVHQRIWEKVAFNSGMNAVSALSHGTPDFLRQRPDALELVRAVAKEVATVASTQQVAIEIDTVNGMIDLAVDKHGHHAPSMLQDLLAGRRTEVDALNGAVVAQAEKAGIPTPLNSTLATLVRLAELAHVNAS